MDGRRSNLSHLEARTWVSSYHTDFLRDDFNTRVVPYRLNSEPYELAADGIAPQDVNWCLASGLQTRGPVDFIRTVASALLMNHEVWLEVVFDDETMNRSPFTVLQIDGVRLTTAGEVVQERPIRRRPIGWNPGEDRWKSEIGLDPEQLVHVSLPDAYPSQLLMQVVRDLAEIKPFRAVDWMMARLTGQGQDTPRFDVNEGFRTEKLRTMQAALPIGWVGRENYYSYDRPISDYYFFWRELRFLHFRASMRACAEAAMSRVIALASARCGFEASAFTKGIYTPCEVEGFIRSYEKGEMPFSKVNDITHERDNNPLATQRKVL